MFGLLLYELCPRCDEIKPRTEFYAHNQRSSKLQLYCKQCCRDLNTPSNQTYRERHLQRTREAQRRSYYKHQDERKARQREKYHNDPEYRARCQEKARQRRARMRQQTGETT